MKLGATRREPLKRTELQPVEFHNARGLRLAADYWPPAGARSDAPVVILVHGFTSDRFSRGRFPQICNALAAAGFGSLAFDFAGCGDSDDDVLTPNGQLDDLLAAIRFAARLPLRHGEIVLWGHSLGGLVCLRAYSPRIAAMVVTGAPTTAIQYDWRSYFSADQLSELAESGQFRVAVEHPRRNHATVSRRLLDDLGAIDQRTLLSGVRCGVLFIYGDADAEERLLARYAGEGLRYLPAASRLELIEGSAHGFEGHLSDVIARALPWLSAVVLGERDGD